MTTNRPEYLREWRKRHPLTDAQREQNRIRWERWHARHGKDTDLDKQLSLLADVPAVEVEPRKPTLISARQVREAEGLKEYKRTPHVCRFYPPYFVCVCGAHREARVTA